VIELSSIRGRHQGCEIAVLGGGPTLLQDLRHVPHDAILIGVNQHTLLLNLDYLYFFDEAVYEAVRDTDALICTHHRDVAQIATGVIPDFGLSGPMAVWMADLLGAARVIVAGCDNYGSDRRYWHSLPGTATQPTTGGMEPWRRCRDHLQHPERVFVASGPLTEVFQPCKF
jgi:hypothetical protein